MSNLDPYLPGPETPAGQEVRFAAGLASVVREHRRPHGYGGPMALALGMFVLIIIGMILAMAL